MRRTLIILATLCGVVLAGGWIYLTRQPAPLTQLAADLAEDGFNGAVLIRHGDEILLQTAAGSASCDDQRANNIDTAFSIGSITKMFTAIAIGQLDAEGALKTEDPIGVYLDDVPADKADITIAQLLDHTAGLETYHETQGRGDYERMDAETARAEILRRPLLATPGSQENYSNSGYTLLALIIEVVSGQTYTDYVTEHIFAPAGMTRSGFWSSDIRNLAETPTDIVGCAPPSEWPYSYVLVGNGGIVSTVGDMDRWMTALAGETLLNNAAKERVGLNRAYASAGGSSQHEFSGLVVTLPGIELQLVALSNRATPPAEELETRLILTTLRQLYLPYRGK